VTVAERDELLDAVDRVERETDDLIPSRSDHDPLIVALADLIARAIRVWLHQVRPDAD
jgi:hypothetical protein